MATHHIWERNLYKQDNSFLHSKFKFIFGHVKDSMRSKLAAWSGTLWARGTSMNTWSVWLCPPFNLMRDQRTVSQRVFGAQRPVKVVIHGVFCLTPSSNLPCWCSKRQKGSPHVKNCEPKTKNNSPQFYLCTTCPKITVIQVCCWNPSLCVLSPKCILLLLIFLFSHGRSWQS